MLQTLSGTRLITATDGYTQRKTAN